MSNYYNNQESKVNIMHELVKRGWKVYGYRPDQSDSMTDYWCPAHWDGIAEKNGYILCVDVRSMHDSGRKVYRNTYNKQAFTHNKRIQKLIALRDDPAASEGEKANAQAMIDRFMAENNEQKAEVIEQYPEFKNVNPKGNNWHLEKDGVIIDKGKGVFTCYVSNNHIPENKAKQDAAIKAFVDRVEKAIASRTKVQAEVIKEVVKVTKPVEVNKNTLEVDDIIQFNGYTNFWKVYRVTETGIFIVRLGKKYQELSKFSQGNTYHYNKQSILNGVQAGRIKIYQMQEVEEVQEKTVYKKVINPQEENLVAGEVAKQQEQTKQTKKATGTAQKIELEIKINEELNGIELHFSSKPDQTVIEQLKNNGFRWSKRGFWYAKITDERLNFAQTLVPKQEEKAQAEKAITDVSVSCDITLSHEITEQQKTESAKVLIFEGAGWEKAESGIVSGVGNCRIRTRLRNNDGRVIYLELSGFIHSEKNKPKFAQDFKVVGHVDHCFYADSRWDANRHRSDELSHLESIHFEYSKENILKLVNEYLNCSFDDMIVINDGSIRVFDNTEPLCSCVDDYVPYKEIEININVLENVTPMALWPHHRFAKYKISYDFVKQLKNFGEWISERHPKEQERYHTYTFYAGLRWDENGVITSAEISAIQGDFCLMSIGSESLICLIKEILTMNIYNSLK